MPEAAVSAKSSAPEAHARTGVNAIARALQPAAGPGGPVLRLQQAIGNRATRALLDSSTRDTSEREADTIAEQVTIAGTRRDPVTPLSGTTAVAAALQARDLHTSSVGRPLPDGMRASMEARLGAELDGVRIHDDQPSRAMAEAIDARAFTVRDHIFLGGDATRDGSSELQLLLAHEFVHVLQQRSGGGLWIQRKPKSEKSVPATADDKRQFIQEV